MSSGVRWRPGAETAADIEEASAPPDGDGALARVERTYLLARAIVAVGLVLAHAALAGSGVASSRLAWLVISIYTVQTLALRVWGALEPVSGVSRAGPLPWKPSVWRIVSTLGVDFATFAVLHAQQSGANFNFAALLVLPVLMAGVLLPRRLALALAAGVTLSLLAVAWHESLRPGGGANLMQSGLVGIGFFVIAWIGGELAGRLLREERVARGSLALARQQSALSRLVIDEMGEGVVVVDRHAQVRALNPAARSLLGLARSTAEDGAAWSLFDRPAWAPLAELVQRAFAEGRWPQEGQEIALEEPSRPRVQVRVRMRFNQPQSSGGAPSAPSAGPESAAFGILLIEDGRAAHARLQQEKLAAMGRVSAGIAHEIRNPLAAIAQANALLMEEALPAPQQRLAGIVTDNVRRLQRIVDEVLAVVPGREEPDLPIDPVPLLRTVIDEWCRAQGWTKEFLRLELPASAVTVAFDPEHLRRVVVNLLDNALTHGSGRPGSIAVRLVLVDETAVRLLISNDGPSVPHDVAAHLFEPFFSTRSRGSGLGLYICRELCGRHRARIEHQGPGRSVGGQSGSGATFVVTLRRLAEVPAVGHAHPSVRPPAPRTRAA